jgi:anti-anti-sigma factor
MPPNGSRFGVGLSCARFKDKITFTLFRFILNVRIIRQKAAMEITTSQKQARVAVTVMKVTGKVDSSTYQEFSDAIKKSVARGTHYLLLDLEACDYMSSAGIRSLNEAYLLFKKSYPIPGEDKIAKSPWIKLLNPSDKIASVLAISGVDTVFETHTDMTTAVASF